MNRKKWMQNAVVAIYVLSVTYMMGKWAIYYAYLERGYVAVGGEYLFIPIVAWIAYKTICKFLDLLEEKGDAETGSRGDSGI